MIGLMIEGKNECVGLLMSRAVVIDCCSIGLCLLGIYTCTCRP